jgi:glyceraldehyde-3-phosphate dehydrogenase/erythrose-4-phosphate dehydrogenase
MLASRAEADEPGELERGASMAVRVGINGFGRIGRNIMRAALGDKNIDFVAVNDLTSAATLAHLFKYDSVLGNLRARIEAKADAICVDGDEFKVLSMRDPAQLPWKDLGVEVVFESTGLSPLVCSPSARTPRSTSPPAPGAW